MRPGRLHHLRRRLWFRFAAGKGVRLLLEAASLASPILLVIFIGTAGYVGSSKFFSRIPAAVSSEPHERQQQSDINRHRVGSILFVPWTGVSTCEERRFDNLTGRIVSDGVIDCDSAPPPDGSNPPARSSDNTVRMRAILDAFKK